MESTLFTNPVEPTPHNAYTFTSNNVKNVTLFADADPLYAITTDLVSDTHTHVNDARTGHRIANITRRDIFPDTVTFLDRRHNSGKPINVHKWLRNKKFLDGSTVHVMQTPVGIPGQYVWRSDATHRLGLYQVNEDHTQPCVAYLQPASTHPLTLFLDPTVEPIRDDILVACLILEQRLRVMDRNINIGGGKFEENMTVFGRYVHT